MSKQRIVVTGGSGYVGSHTVVALQQAGYDVLLLDNFQNSGRDVPSRISEITGKAVDWIELDIVDRAALTSVLSKFHPDGVIHFAGLKAVDESIVDPLQYYDVNVMGSLSLFHAMETVSCKRLIFSSSATVYGEPQQVPIPESHALNPKNPYGRSKLMVERIIEDYANSSNDFSAVSLRYFNPVGAHPSSKIGEAPLGRPGNLMPYLAKVAAGELGELSVFGDDYDTHDGTGVRDYIHVMDLAYAHLAALNLTKLKSGVSSVNVGTGRGHSVLELLRTFEAVSDQRLPIRMAPRRPGDVAISIADPSLAQKLLGWEATYSLEDMCAHVWAWQRRTSTSG